MTPKPLIAAALVALLATPVLAEGDADAGEKVYRKCKSCHDVGDDAKNKTGPHLNGIMNAAAAQNPDFKYSDAMVEAAAGGLVWDQESLTTYLTKPKEMIPGTKMTFAGLRKEKDIIDILAYLAQFSPEMEEMSEGEEAPASN